jgi:hypothetical protein
MDLNLARRKREREIAQAVVEELVANVTPETVSNEVIAHHFGVICQRLDFIPTEASGKRVLQYVAKELARLDREAARLLRNLGE